MITPSEIPAAVPGDRPAKGVRVKFTKANAAGEEFVDYKDVDILRKLMTSNGKIQPRRRTGGIAYRQRMLSQAIKRARFMALLPFTTAPA